MSHAVIFNPYNSWIYHFNYEVPIYYNLLSRGIKPIYLNCGMPHPDCDMFQKAVIGDRPKNACANCISINAEIIAATGLKNHSMGEYLDPIAISSLSAELRSKTLPELQEITYEDLNVYDLAISSVYTHLRINKIDSNSPLHLETIANYMLHALSTLISGSVFLAKFRPIAALVFNGRMAATRAFVELCKKHGVRVVTHERGMTRGALSIWVDDICNSTANYDYIKEKRIQRPLIEYQVDLVKQWVDDRRTGRNLNWQSFQLPNSTKFDQSNKSDIVNWVLFTTSMDELVASKHITSVFTSQFNWIEQTVAIALEESTKVTLTIRVHPNSSSSISTGHNMEEKTFFSSLKERLIGTNVTVIESSDSIDSYTVLDSADLVLCFASTISLESLLAKKKTFLAAYCEWSRCSGIEGTSSHQEYHVFLKKHTEKAACQLNPNALVSGYRFVYQLLTSNQFIFPFIEQLNKSENRLITNDPTHFNEGNYPVLDRVVDILLGEQELIQSEPAFYGPEDLEREIAYICKTKIVENRPFFSVIITNYNYASYIEACIGSVLMQTEKDFEIIIVDDGSTDGSQAIIARIANHHPDVRIYPIFQNNSGQPAIARNNGIYAAKGRFILPLDADDMIADDYLAGCKAILERRPEVNLVYADSIHIYPDRAERHPPGIFSTGHLAVSNQIVIASVFSKWLWEKVKGYSVNVRGYEDWDLWLKMSLNGAIPAYYNGVGLLYNCKGGGLLSEAQEKHSKLFANVILNNRLAYRSNLPLVRWAEQFLRSQNEDKLPDVL